MKPQFLGLFEDRNSVLNEYRVLATDKFANAEILLAYYDRENYSGNSFVLMRQDGKLYEVNSSHCSCNGLEEQWRPEETSIPALVARLEKGDLGRAHSYSDSPGENEFAEELISVISELSK